MPQKIIVSIFLLCALGPAFGQGIESLEELRNFRSPLMIEKAQYDQLADALTSPAAQLDRLGAAEHSARAELETAIYAAEPNRALIDEKLSGWQTAQNERTRAQVLLFLAQRPLLSGEQRDKLRRIKTRQTPVPQPPQTREFNAGYAEHPPEPPAGYAVPPIAVYPEAELRHK